MALVAIVQVATLSYGVMKDENAERPSDEQVESGEYEPNFSGINFIDWATTPFRSGPELSQSDVRLSPNETREVGYSLGEKDEAIYIEVTAGYGVQVQYDCVVKEKGDRCPQKMCLCAENARIDPADFNTCGELRPSGQRCKADESNGKIIINKEEGGVSLTALGRQVTKVQLR